MKTLNIVVLLLLINGITYYLLSNRIEKVDEDLMVELQIAKRYTKISSDASLNREQAMQDSLEERITKVERDLETIHYFIGHKK